MSTTLCSIFFVLLVAHSAHCSGVECEDALTAQACLRRLRTDPTLCSGRGRVGAARRRLCRCVCDEHSRRQGNNLPASSESDGNELL